MYMREIQSKAEKIAHEKWKDAASEINEELMELGKKEKAAESTGDSEVFTREDAMRQKHVLNARGKFQTYMRQIPVLGFNSSRFDINLVKQKLLLQLGLHATASNSEYVIKKGNAYIYISSEHFKFLDILQFLVPGRSYASFLKAYGVNDEKGIIPYLWFDAVEKLDKTSLPERECFSDTFKSEELSEDDYRGFLQVWEEHGMKMFKDYLKWYNNLDVKPFVEAVSKLQCFYTK